MDKGKILIEGMDLSGKTTVARCIQSIVNVESVQCRTLMGNNQIHDFTVKQSKEGNLPRQLISELYELAIKEEIRTNKKWIVGCIVILTGIFTHHVKY